MNALGCIVLYKQVVDLSEADITQFYFIFFAVEIYAIVLVLVLC